MMITSRLPRTGAGRLIDPRAWLVWIALGALLYLAGCAGAGRTARGATQATPATADAKKEATDDHSTPDFMTGVDANYAPDLAGRGTVWQVGGRPVDLYQALRQAGADSFRVRVWTGDGGPSGRDCACAAALRAQAAGLKPYLVFFLSENWADYVKQPAPAAWQALSFTDKLTTVTAYSERTARFFAKAGVKADHYEIGNEIDFGLCGEYEEDWGQRFSLEYMQGRIWPRAAQVIRAAETGIQRVNSQAKFILHLTQWWNPDYCVAFLDSMRAGGVQVDFLGLSFFPTSGLAEKQTFADLGESVRQIHGRTGRPVIVCEYAYPSLPEFGGQFATWNKPVAGYPLSEAGQWQWITHFLAFCRAQPAIAGAYYWSPEWYPEEMWKAFALFKEDGQAKKGFGALGAR